MQDIVLTFLRSGAELPSPPAIAVRILEETKKDDCSLDGLARIIEADPALALKILRLSNSSYYGLVAKVKSLPRALSVLGLNAVKNIVLSFVLIDNFRNSDENAFNYDLFWRRSVTAAVSADLVSEVIGKPNEDIFLTALLQNIGVLLLYICRQEDYLGVLEDTRFNPSSWEAVEAERFGFNHQDVGTQVLKDWGLPENIYRPIGFHHSPQEAPSDFREISRILRIADNLSLLYTEEHSAVIIETLKRDFDEHFDIPPEQVDDLIDTTARRTVELLSIFDIPPGGMKPFSQILQDANTELGRLNLTYEQLVLQYKSAKESAENLARELQKANQKLRQLATTDGLTGLYNHRTFQDLLEKRVGEANRHKRHLTLALLDLDNFKQVNDGYGHSVGDAVLKAVSAKIAGMLRREDIFARYGGEEFAVILPETEIKGAMQLADRLRKAVAQMVLNIKGASLSVTVSIGLSSNLPHLGKCDKADLIDASDKALYMAKSAGRNAVRIALLNPTISDESHPACSAR
ncbi:MAG: GGDEF domain-containing protein [Desulfosarcinaceae bacterium]|nr:GGDEF domain-containing protein [Desulfosarcinaceae bacterium]